MNSKILNLSHNDEWKLYCTRLPHNQQDIYSTPEYYKLFENKGEGVANCFIYENKNEFCLYPFLLNSLNSLDFIKFNKEFYDIQGAYGYSGPLSTTNNETHLTEFNKAFLHYCSNNNIVAEFIRFNPIIQNHKFTNYIIPLNVNDNVMIDLTLSEEDIWMKSFIKKRRGSIRIAQKNDLYCKFFCGYEMTDELLNTFLNIYYSTMDRNIAENYYYYKRDFFNDLTKSLAFNSLFTFVYKDDEVISSELVIYSKYIAYALFGGTLSEHYYLNPNSYLRFELLKYLKKKNIGYYSMGGGYQRGDKLYKFKLSFSRNCKSLFHIGKKIHNEKIYNIVCENWKKKYPNKVEKYKNLLLKYRY